MSFNRYGFVTFETQEDALKILNNVSSLVFCIGIFHAYNNASNLTGICCLYVMLLSVRLFMCFYRLMESRSKTRSSVLVRLFESINLQVKVGWRSSSAGVWTCRLIVISSSKIIVITGVLNFRLMVQLLQAHFLRWLKTPDHGSVVSFFSQQRAPLQPALNLPCLSKHPMGPSTWPQPQALPTLTIMELPTSTAPTWLVLPTSGL